MSKEIFDIINSATSKEFNLNMPESFGNIELGGCSDDCNCQGMPNCDCDYNPGCSCENYPFGE